MPEGPSLQAVYPHRRHLAGKVRALIDHLVDWFETQPGALAPAVPGQDAAILRLLLPLLGLLAGAGHAGRRAHPHIFIDAKATIIFNDRGRA